MQDNQPNLNVDTRPYRIPVARLITIAEQVLDADLLAAFRSIDFDTKAYDPAASLRYEGPGMWLTHRQNDPFGDIGGCTMGPIEGPSYVLDLMDQELEGGQLYAFLAVGRQLHKDLGGYVPA